MNDVIAHFESIGVPTETVVAIGRPPFPISIRARHDIGVIRVGEQTGNSGLVFIVESADKVGKHPRAALISNDESMTALDGPATPHMGGLLAVAWEILIAIVHKWRHVPPPARLLEHCEGNVKVIARTNVSDPISSLPEGFCKAVGRLTRHVADSEDIWKLLISQDRIALAIRHAYKPNQSVVYGVPPNGDVMALLDVFLEIARWRWDGNAWVDLRESSPGARREC
jgi:hypothetical protein